jgi:LDH2 family malate/lactate/ureidoglycolate dehydrogenase
MDEALGMAESFGLGLVGVRNSTHFGMAASYLLQALERGFAALVFTNASRALPPWGGRQELFGTSPFGAVFPGDPPFLLDMAPTIVARGKIRKAAREGRPIPEGWALDEAGRPTTDAARAMTGVLLPIGGPKGAALSMMMDIFGGLFTGARFAGDVGNQYKDYERPQGVGHLFLAIKPDLFLSRDEIAARMDHLVATVRASPTAEGVDEILMPGEPEARTEAARRREGIPYRREDLAPLVAAAREAGLALPGALAGEVRKP